MNPLNKKIISDGINESPEKTEAINKFTHHLKFLIVVASAMKEIEPQKKKRLSIAFVQSGSWKREQSVPPVQQER